MPSSDWRVITLHQDAADILAVEEVSDKPLGPVRDDETARFCERLKSRGQVWCLPHGGALQRRFQAELVANNDNARRDTDTSFEVHPGPKLSNGLDHFEAAADGSLCIILVRHGIAEPRHHTVTQELSDRSVKFPHDLVAAGVIGANEISEILWI